jgi:REP element-mobilizing transposase RayT
MARANRHYIPGYVWHLTHRCHKREFLLKFSEDKRRWLQWLFEARKRFGFCVLNYMVTSNHIHLLVLDNGKEVIPRSIQLIAGKTGQEYNQRKDRKGAFWEDRYHATAVESDSRLIKCLVYIDLNMVRAGVVEHPSGWPFSGYHEIQNPPKRYSLIDRKRLMDLLSIRDSDQLRIAHKQWVEEILKEGSSIRETKWTESIAVGSKAFVEVIQKKLGIKAKGRKVVGDSDTYELREAQSSYDDFFGLEKGILRSKNTYLWNTYSNKSI